MCYQLSSVILYDEQNLFQEINMLQNAVANFANDLNLISETIKSRTVQQVDLIFTRQYFILFSKDFRLMSHIF